MNLFSLLRSKETYDLYLQLNDRSVSGTVTIAIDNFLGIVKFETDLWKPAEEYLWNDNWQEEMA